MLGQSLAPAWLPSSGKSPFSLPAVGLRVVSPLSVAEEYNSDSHTKVATNLQKLGNDRLIADRSIDIGMAQGRAKDHLKTPEGLYRLFSERKNSLVSFKPERLPKLAVGEESTRQKIYLLHAVADVVEVCEYGACDKVT